MMPIVSVTICTYDRAEVLGAAIESLCHQAVSTGCFEIIIVDNGSTNPIAKLVGYYQTRYPKHSIKLVNETRQGLGYARNQALSQAHGEYIAYIDDDARVESHWLAHALLVLQNQPEEFVCLGGPILPFYTTPKPVWFQDEYETRSMGDTVRALEQGESFSGSNMIWKRDVLLSIGGFDEKVGVKGSKLSTGEETAAFIKAWQQLETPHMQYDPHLIVNHWVPGFKMTVSYRLKRAFAAGQTVMKIGHFRHRRAYLFLAACKGVIAGGLKALRRIKRYPYWQNWIVEEGQPIMANLGTILAAFGIYFSVRQDRHKTEE
jgi:glycosyltransferase involved in cell wall biosynthesis